MKLEHNQLIQGLIALKWMSKEAVPLLSTRMYEAETSTVGKLRAHGLTSEAIFEAANFANQDEANPIPVADLAMVNILQDFDFSTFASIEEMETQFVVPVCLIAGRLKVATADPYNEKFFDILALRSLFPIDYWLAESDGILATIGHIALTHKPQMMSMNPPLTMPAILADNQQPEQSEAPTTDEFIAVPEGDTDSSSHHDHEFDAEDVSAESAPPAIDHEDDDFAEDDRFAALQDSSLNADELEAMADDDDDAETAHFTEAILVDSHDDLTLIPVDDVPDENDEKTIDESDEQLLLNESLAVLPEVEQDEYIDMTAVEHIDNQHSPIEAVTLETLKGLEAEVATKILLTGSRAEADLSDEVELDSEVISAQSSAEMLKEVLDEVGTKAEAQPAEDDIIEYINFVLLDALTQKASDIHFEPYEMNYRIRFRIDGILHKVYAVPEQYRNVIASRLKVMAELDIAERRLPQDGHITICLEDDEIDARISVIPTLWGEKVVIRLLDNSEMNLSLEKLGLAPAQKGMIQASIEKSQGLILVTGPTGSGKTVTLYACLNHLNKVSRNIATVEDPIEINLEGINQLQVHPKIGLNFAEALRAFLRQDPDVLMVGEIRDHETADITMKAAQTGHLVLSTLHTNSAVESLVRLENMGIERYNIASTVKLVIAQRLVRELCHCKEEDIVDSDYLQTLGFTPMQAASRFYRASGCSECHDGYRGRFAIFEVMPISKRMEQRILEGAFAADIRVQAEREGVKSLRQSGIDMIIEGRTTLEEVLRVTAE